MDVNAFLLAPDRWYTVNGHIYKKYEWRAASACPSLFLPRQLLGFILVSRAFSYRFLWYIFTIHVALKSVSLTGENPQEVLAHL